MHLLIDLGNTRIKWSLVDSNGESHSDGNQGIAIILVHFGTVISTISKSQNSLLL